MSDPQSLLKQEEHRKRFEHFVKNPTRPSDAEQQRVVRALETEYAWWGSAPGYATEEQIRADHQTGELVEVRSDENFKLILRFNNPDLNKWQPYLKKGAYGLLREVTQLWRKSMDESAASKKIQLSVTNLVVSEHYREEVIQQGRLAHEKSSHTKGESFDIDGAGYYEDGEPVNPRLTQDYHERYDPTVHIVLEQVLTEMLHDHKLNYIKEFPDTGNQSFHITRNPNYTPGL